LYIEGIDIPVISRWYPGGKPVMSRSIKNRDISGGSRAEPGNKIAKNISK
jgi:hypothetical protein